MERRIQRRSTSSDDDSGSDYNLGDNLNDNATILQRPQLQIQQPQPSSNQTDGPAPENSEISESSGSTTSVNVSDDAPPPSEELEEYLEVDPDAEGGVTIVHDKYYTEVEENFKESKMNEASPANNYQVNQEPSVNKGQIDHEPPASNGQINQNVNRVDENRDRIDRNRGNVNSRRKPVEEEKVGPSPVNNTSFNPHLHPQNMNNGSHNQRFDYQPGGVRDQRMMGPNVANLPRMAEANNAPNNRPLYNQRDAHLQYRNPNNLPNQPNITNCSRESSHVLESFGMVSDRISEAEEKYNTLSTRYTDQLLKNEKKNKLLYQKSEELQWYHQNCTCNGSQIHSQSRRFSQNSFNNYPQSSMCQSCVDQNVTIQNLNRQNEDMRTQQQQTKDENESLKNELNQLKHELGEVNRRLETQEIEHKSTVDATNRECAELHKKLELTQEKVSNLTNSNSNLEAKYKSGVRMYKRMCKKAEEAKKDEEIKRGEEIKKAEEMTEEVTNQLEVAITTIKSLCEYANCLQNPDGGGLKEDSQCVVMIGELIKVKNLIKVFEKSEYIPNLLVQGEQEKGSPLYKLHMNSIKESLFGKTKRIKFKNLIINFDLKFFIEFISSLRHLDSVEFENVKFCEEAGLDSPRTENTKNKIKDIINKKFDKDGFEDILSIVEEIYTDSVSMSD